MRLVPIALFTAGLALAGCDSGPVALDIVEIGPARSAMFPREAGVRPDAVALDLDVRAGQLRAVLERRGAFDLFLFDCGAPEGPGETVPVYFGGEPIIGMYGSQVSDNPEMSVLLNAAAPRSVVALERPCARFVGRAGTMAPELTSRPIPLPPLQGRA